MFILCIREQKHDLKHEMGSKDRDLPQEFKKSGPWLQAHTTPLLGTTAQNSGDIIVSLGGLGSVFIEGGETHESMSRSRCIGCELTTKHGTSLAPRCVTPVA